MQFFTATFLRAVAQLAVLKGQEKEIREVLPRTGWWPPKKETSLIILAQNMAGHTETFCLNGDFLQKISEKYPLDNGFDLFLRGNDITMHWSFDSTP